MLKYRVDIEKIKKAFPNASVSFLERNNERNTNHSPLSSPEPKQIVRHEPLAKDEGKKGNSGRISVSIRSYRRRLIDPDNMVGKYFCDSLRYGRFIPDDDAKTITYQIDQIRVGSAEEERTEIRITYPE